MVIIYVDDLIILASYMIKIEWVKSKPDKEFDMSDFRKLNYCLEVELEKDRAKCTIIMSQKNTLKECLSSSI